METASASTFVDILGNVMVVPAGVTQTAQDEPPHGRRKAAPDAKVEDWGSLFIGQKVSLWRRKTFIAWGNVDEVMPDGTAVWLFIPKEFRRMLVHVTDGLTLSLVQAS